jgi:tRNA threonylcarbamoyladenosine biosynthesis protein TsaB
MIVLAIETATREGSVAVVNDDVILAARAGEAARPHAARLPGDALEALAVAGLTLDDVSMLAVCLGPGAFTGLRVGIAAAQGLAFAMSSPIVGISALEALALHALDDGSADDVAGVWMDAARGEVFAARYTQDHASPTRLAPVDEPVSARPEVVRSRWHVEGRAVTRWIGDGAVRYRAHLPEDADLRTSPLLAPLVGRLAIARRGEAGAPHALRPLYVRPPDAELARRR